MGVRAAAIRMTRCDVKWHGAERRSSRTRRSTRLTTRQRPIRRWLNSYPGCTLRSCAVWAGEQFRGKGAIRATISIR